MKSCYSGNIFSTQTVVQSVMTSVHRLRSTQ